MFRWVEHTAELELEIEAPSAEAVFTEALAAFAELIGDSRGAPAARELTLEADDPPLLLVGWFEQLIYWCETEGFVPERVASLTLTDRSVEGRTEGHVGDPGHLVKAVTLHRLEFRQVGETWRARVVLDV